MNQTTEGSSTLNNYAEFLQRKGFTVHMREDHSGFTAVIDGVSHTVIGANQHPEDIEELIDKANGAVVAFPGPVDRALAHRLTLSGIRVVWWNGEIWNGCGSSFGAGMTSM